MKFVIAGSGASGAIYLQRLLGKMDARAHEVHLVLSAFAKQVIHEELGELKIPDGVHQHGDRSMNVAFPVGFPAFETALLEVGEPMGGVHVWMSWGWSLRAMQVRRV